MLFECLCFVGDYERALQQLDVIGHQSSEAELGVSVYRQLLAAQTGRQRVLSQGGKPQYLQDPPAHVTEQLEALQHLAAGEVDQARTLIEGAIEKRTVLPGTLDGRTFSDLSDSDDLLAPVLEVAILDQYFWIPFEQIKTIAISPPTQNRDMLWLEAKLELRNGRAVGVSTFPLYHLTHEDSDERVQLGRVTDWIDAGAGLMRGVGQRLLLVDGQEVPFLDVREISFGDLERPQAAEGGPGREE
jgi:type VI secretion system protein ImpE